MKDKQIISFVGVVVITWCFLFSLPSNAEKIFINQSVKQNSTPPPSSQLTDSLPYTGRVRIYIVEPVSRWKMANQEYYHFGFLGFAYNNQISINYGETFDQTITWDGDSLVNENNIMVIAAVFNPERYPGYARPPSQNPFDAYYVDATAGARPGQTGYNRIQENFTHTVLVEESTATWCGYCPSMADVLYSIYQSGEYPYYFVALVDDKNTQAAQRNDEFNLYGFPTAFFDGGYKVLVGGQSSDTTARNYIKNSGKRNVHELNLSVSVAWLGNGDLSIHFTITNNEMINPPETPSAPTGPTQGYSNIEYTYTAVTTDPNNDKILYKFDWGDGTSSDWIGPKTSGEPITAKHTWTADGAYQVKVKAKDVGGGGYETSWSAPLSVQIQPAQFNIVVAGGKSIVTATITNAGASTLPSVEWRISVKGGIFGRIDIVSTGTLINLAPNTPTEVSTDKTLFGVGKLAITVTADTTVKEFNGFIFGPFIIIR
ncbi:MAG: hypothetical protein QXL17_01970 [Candidatus Thermoplasmatota archaeon]